MSGLAWVTAFGQQAAQVAAPESASSGELAEVVVTAQRRAERLQDVGISVAAFSGDMLKQQGVTTSTDIARFTPGVTASGTLGGQGLQFSIRGVTQADYDDAIEGPVAVYIDDTYVSSQQGQGMALYDIERVEALKGPQGTLFGRNATGGLVNFIVKTPDLSGIGGYTDVTYGRFDQTIVEAGGNLPLNDSIAIRASGIWNRHGAVWNNVYPQGMVAGAPLVFGPTGVSPAGQNLGAQDDMSGRLQVLWKVSDDLSLRLTGSALRQNLSESPWTSTAVVPVVDSGGRVVGGEYASGTETRAAIGPGGANYYNPSVLPFQGFLFSPNKDGHRAPGADWFGYVPVNISDRNLSKDFALNDLNRFRAHNAALHIDAKLGSADLTSVTSYSTYDKTFLLDADGSPVDGLAFGTKSTIRTLSQEVRLSGDAPSLRWVAGAYFLDIDANVAQGLLAPKGSALAAVFGAASTGVDPISVFDLRTKSASIFGQTSWEFVPRFTLVFGARLIREQQSYRYSSDAYANISDYSVDTTTKLFNLYPAFNDSRANYLWAGKTQLEFRPDETLLTYVGVNRGVKAGSYNGKIFDGSPALAAADIPYKAETLVSFEGGFKYSAPSHLFTIDGAVYHYQYHDYQSFVFTDISGSVQNTDAHTNGAELDGTLRLTRSWRVELTGSVNDATVKGLQIAPGIQRDTKPAYAPKYSSSASLNYTVPRRVLDGDIDLGVRADYQSSFFHNARNFDSDLVGGRTLVDVNANWGFTNGLDVGFYVNNLFDKRYETVGLDLATACGCNLVAYGMPMTWGVKAGYKF